jgi:hypothetical protein
MFAIYKRDSGLRNERQRELPEDFFLSRRQLFGLLDRRAGRDAPGLQHALEDPVALDCDSVNRNHVLIAVVS